MRVVIDPTGNIHAVWSDALASIPGKKSVTRASNVEFNETEQLWEARLPDGELIASGKDRDKVIAKEVKIVEERLVKRLISQQ